MGLRPREPSPPEASHACSPVRRRRFQLCPPLPRRPSEGMSARPRHSMAASRHSSGFSENSSATVTGSGTDCAGSSTTTRTASRHERAAAEQASVDISRKSVGARPVRPHAVRHGRTAARDSGGLRRVHDHRLPVHRRQRSSWTALSTRFGSGNRWRRARSRQCGGAVPAVRAGPPLAAGGRQLGF
jgi:hypothetical protein